MLEQDKWFYFAGGRSAKDIPDLIHALKEISEEEFMIHVNNSKNDLANWVEGVFGYGDLAYELRHLLEKRDTIALLRRFLYMQKSHSEDLVKKEIEDAVKFTSDQLPYASPKETVTEQQVLKTFTHPDYHPSPQESFNDALHDASKSIVQDEVHEEVELKVTSEHDLEEDHLRDIADDARQEIHIEGRMIEDRKKAHEAQAIGHHLEHNKFIVREFIYGFFMGMIFGLMMLGVLQNMM